MNKNSKKIIENLINWNKKDTIELVLSNKDKAEDIHIKVKPQLELEDRLLMVNEIYRFVCDMSEDSEPSIANYQPGLLNYARRYAVILYYTDLDVVPDEADNMKMLNKLIMNTPLYEEIMNIVHEEAEVIFEEADELIKTYRDAAIMRRNFNSIISKVDKIIDGVTNEFKDINVEEIKGLLAKFKNADIQDILAMIHSDNIKKNVG